MPAVGDAPGLRECCSYRIRIPCRAAFEKGESWVTCKQALQRTIASWWQERFAINYEKSGHDCRTPSAVARRYKSGIRVQQLFYRGQILRSNSRKQRVCARFRSDNLTMGSECNQNQIAKAHGCVL